MWVLICHLIMVFLDEIKLVKALMLGGLKDMSIGTTINCCRPS